MNDEDEIKKNEMKKQNKDLIEDDEIEEEEKKENINEENKIENGLNDSKDDATNISEKGENNKHKEKVVLNKYIPKNEQEALKAKIINLELKEKPNHELDYNSEKTQKNFYYSYDISNIRNYFNYLRIYKSNIRCNSWRRNNVLGIRFCCYDSWRILFLSILQS